MRSEHAIFVCLRLLVLYTDKGPISLSPSDTGGQVGLGWVAAGIDPMLAPRIAGKNVPAPGRSQVVSAALRQDQSDPGAHLPGAEGAGDPQVPRLL